MFSGISGATAYQQRQNNMPCVRMRDLRRALNSEHPTRERKSRFVENATQVTMEHLLTFPQLLATINHILVHTTYFSVRSTVDVRALGVTDYSDSEFKEAVVWETNVRHALRVKVLSLLDFCVENHGLSIMGPVILARLR